MTARTFRTVALTSLLTALLSGLPPAALGAQTKAAPARPAAPARAEAQPPTAAPAFIDDQSARDTRERLRMILEQYPPSVAQVLRLDPTLIQHSEYLQTYPTLAAFLAQHTEIAHNPSFYLGDMRFNYRPEETDRSRAMNMMEDVLGGVAALIVFAGVMSLLAWVLRALFDYRYWLRASKIQTEAHQKIFDRLTSNEDLLAYVQSPAGQKFLTSSSISIERGTRGVSAPVSRILWSVQAGVVVMLAGGGLWLARTHVFDELSQLLYIVSLLAVSLGFGFVLSALASYALSRRLGLLDQMSRSSHA
jgi:hypothetical protein